MKYHKIAIGSDHAGFDKKELIKKKLQDAGIEVLDKGTNSSESVDYPDFAHPVADAVESGEAEIGIVFCGSGNGVAMTVNKHKGIRAALVWTKELAALARQHNNANILAIPSRFVDESLTEEMVDAFLKEDFEGGRHERRVNKISDC